MSASLPRRGSTVTGGHIRKMVGPAHAAGGLITFINKEMITGSTLPVVTPLEAGRIHAVTLIHGIDVIHFVNIHN